MAFCYSDIECTVRECFHQFVHGTACRHCWSDTYDTGILLRQFHESLTEYILKLRRFVLVIGSDAGTGIWVELSRSVPDGGSLLCRLVSLAFLGVDMQELRSAHILEL